MVTSLDTSLLHFDQNKLFKNGVYLGIVWVVWATFQKIGGFFTKSSGHPDNDIQHNVT